MAKIKIINTFILLQETVAHHESSQDDAFIIASLTQMSERNKN